jgi:hypothetical protein
LKKTLVGDKRSSKVTGVASKKKTVVENKTEGEQQKDLTNKQESSITLSVKRKTFADLFEELDGKAAKFKLDLKRKVKQDV